MKVKRILVNIVGTGMFANSIVAIVFLKWFREDMHFPMDGFSFLIIEGIIAYFILLRWKYSSVLGNFSRIAGLIYAFLELGGMLLLPFEKTYQYLSVKMIGGFYFSFYLFSFLTLIKAKSEFPTPVVIGPPSSAKQVQTVLEIIPLDEKVRLKIRSRLNLIGWIFIMDGLIHLALTVFPGAEKAPGFIHSGAMLTEIAAGLMLLMDYSWARAWVAVISAISFLIFCFMPWIYVWMFNTPERITDTPELIKWVPYFKVHRVSLIIFNSLYGLGFLYVCLFLGRSEIYAYFRERKIIEQKEKGKKSH